MEKPQQMHGLVGGFAPADVNDPFVKIVADFAVTEVEKDRTQFNFLSTVPSDTHLTGKVIQAGMQVCVCDLLVTIRRFSWF